MRFHLTFAIAALALPRVARGQTIPALDAFYRSVAAKAAPFSFSVVVVRNDTVVHLAGYGTLDSVGTRPVTKRTPFYIASSTKSFTALTAALLANRGVLDLDAPIARYAPDFILPSPLDASRVTLRRLLSHRAGFESGPLAFRTAYVGNLAQADLLSVLARTAQAVDTGFTYTNTQFIVAARVMERVTGLKWQDLLLREVGVPLGLESMTARPSRLDPSTLLQGLIAGPSGFARFPVKPDDIMHAAGGLMLSSEDAGRWLRVQLNKGRLGRSQVFPAEVIRETHRPLARQSDRFENIDRFGYALGWQVGLLDDDTLYHHLGNYPGSFAHVSFMPARGTGVAVFANSDMPVFGMAMQVLAQRAYDAALGIDKRAASYAVYADSLGRGTQRMFDIFRSDYQRRATRPKAPPRGWRAYAGTYHEPEYGDLEIVATSDSTAELRFGAMRSPLTTFAGDTVRVEMPVGRNGRPAPVSFGSDGRVATITVNGRVFVR
jgi:CubicO group peptidase (beta-lactamase class C family)